MATETDTTGAGTGNDDVDAYIANFPHDVQERLQRIRATMSDAAPGADEAISYGIPALRVDGKAFIFFAGYARHLAVYPAPRDAPEFADELARYKGGKGTVQFPLGQPVPYDLIARITRFRFAQATDDSG